MAKVYIIECQGGTWADAYNWVYPLAFSTPEDAATHSHNAATAAVAKHTHVNHQESPDTRITELHLQPPTQ